MSGSTDTPIDPCSALKKLDNVYLQLSQGQQVVRYRDQNGEQIDYTAADLDQVKATMQLLQGNCTTYQSAFLTPLHKLRPFQFLFGR